MTRAQILSLAALLLALPLHAADKDKPHPHQGVIAPYVGGPPAVPVTDAEAAVLATGKPVLKTVDGGKGGRGAAVFRVNAPPEVVWSVIGDYKNYPKWIDNVKSIDVYEDKGNVTSVHFTVKAVAISVDYFIKHLSNPEERWITWTLDYSKESDLDDSVGFWQLAEVPGNPGQTQVAYSVDLQVRGWIPGFVRNFLIDSGLKTATSWVKKQAEARYARQQKTAAAREASAPGVAQ